MNVTQASILSSRPINAVLAEYAKRRSSAFSALIWPLAAILLFYISMVHRFLVTGTVPGDLADTGANIYILEHIFQRIMLGNDAYLSPDMFYPYPGTLLLGDTHIGSAIFYVVFRYLGKTEFTSFTLWFFAGYLLTFIAAYWSLLRMRVRPVEAVIAATLFAAGLPGLAEFNQSQLVYRFGVPLAFLSLWNYRRCGRIEHVAWLVMWTSLQVLCSVYIGLFLTATLAVFGGWLLVANRGLRPLHDVWRRSLCDLRSAFEGAWFVRGIASVIVLIPVIGAGLLLSAHAKYGAMYGLGSKSQDSHLMAALSSPKVFYDTWIGAGVPVQHEHGIFIGLGIFFLFVVGVVATVSGHADPGKVRVSRIMLLTLASMLLLVTMLGDQSLCIGLSYLPGLNSVSALTRVLLVLMFPVALVAATGIRAMLQSRPRMPNLGVLVLIVAVLGISMRKPVRFSASESELRTQAIASDARRKSSGIVGPILFVREGSETPDALLAAQRLGWPTVNGYSGNAVPGYDNTLTCDSPARQFAAYETWHRLHGLGPDVSAKDLMRRLVYVGWPECDFAGPGLDPSGANLGPPLDPAAARFISIVPIALQRHGSQVVFEVDIRNQGDTRLYAGSFAPIRLSWRFVAAGTNPEKGSGWEARAAIPRDVLPNGDLRMSVSADIPQRPGDYRLQLSLVAELSFWLHDRGMNIPEFDQVISVR